MSLIAVLEFNSYISLKFKPAGQYGSHLSVILYGKHKQYGG